MRASYWLHRKFRYAFEYRNALLFLNARWPETRVPRTSTPLDFAALYQRGR